MGMKDQTPAKVIMGMRLVADATNPGTSAYFHDQYEIGAAQFEADGYVTVKLLSRQ
jgi:hypothetical protein